MNASELRVRVARKTTEALGIATFELVPADGGALPAFSAGSHVDVHLPNGLTRQYSLCNAPGEGQHYLIGVLHDAASRGGSKALHEAIAVGDVLRISAPKNHFALAHEAAHSVLIAGGIGITPILCMAERLAMSGASFEMHYCTRSPERTAFRQRIAGSPFAPCVQFHFDDGDAAQKFAPDAIFSAARQPGASALSNAIEPGGQVELPTSGTHLYVCGPKGFMDWVLGLARAAGWPADQLHYEFFGAEIVKSADDASFQIKLASSGQVIVVLPEQTVVQALAAAGIEIATSCEQGVCGTCLTRVLDGEPDHKDMYLTPEEQAANDQFTPCCSRARSPMLVLDL